MSGSRPIYLLWAPAIFSSTVGRLGAFPVRSAPVRRVGKLELATPHRAASLGMKGGTCGPV